MAEPTLGKRIISFGTDFGKSFTDMEKFKASMSVVGKTVEETYKHFIKFEHGLLGLASPLGKTVVRFSELGIAAGLLSIAFANGLLRKRQQLCLPFSSMIFPKI